MITALDRVALRLLAQLDGYSSGGRCPTCEGELVPPSASTADIIRIMDRCEKWLKESRKLRPTENEEGAGIAMYHDILQKAREATDKSAFNRLVRDRQPIRGVQPPPVKAGKPTKEEAKQRERYHAAAMRQVEEERDNALAAMVSKINPAQDDE